MAIQNTEVDEFAARLLREQPFQAYEIRGLIAPTAKSVVLDAWDQRLKRKVALKVLRPGQSQERIRQFELEMERAAKVGIKPSNVVGIYFAGNEQNYDYIAMEYAEGETLEDLLKKGKKFSRSEILNIFKSTIGAISYCHENGIVHDDIKPGNIHVTPQGSSTVLLDFGGRLSGNKSPNNDIKSLGTVTKSLFRDSKVKTRGKLERMLERACSDQPNMQYVDIADLKDDFDKYESAKLKKRKIIASFLTATAVLAAAAGISIERKYSITEKVRRDYFPTKLEYLVDKARESGDVSDQIVQDVRMELFKEKVKPLAKKIPKGAFPFATNNGVWFTSSDVSYSNGYWPAILIDAWKVSGDVELEKAARDAVESIKLCEEDRKYNHAVRFFHSHARMYEETGEERYRTTALEAAERLKGKFSKEHGFFTLLSNDKKQLFAATMDVAEFYWWAYGQTCNREYAEMAISHTNAIIAYNKRPEGSVRQVAILNLNTRELIGESNLDCSDESNQSTHARTQAIVLNGVMEAYENTGDTRFLAHAVHLGEYIINHLPEDYIPYSDMHTKSGPKDSSAAALNAEGFSKMFDATNHPKYRGMYIQTLTNLITGYVSTDKKDQGMIKSACLSPRKSKHIDCSLIFGDSAFSRAIPRRDYKD